MRDYEAITQAAEKAIREAIGYPAGTATPEQFSHIIAMGIVSAMQEQERQDNA
mgnify:FL=1